MKKFLTTCALTALVALPAGAAPQSECAYSPRQALVRDARDASQIVGLIEKGVIFDETPRCGGTIMQLAVRRGNAEVLMALLKQDLKRASQIVALDEFPIPGAPKKVPLWLFAAYYAPNENIILLLKQALQQSNQNIAMTDDMGRNVLWYMDRNPVLRQTALYDGLNTELLTSLTMSNPDALLNPNAGAGLAIPGAGANFSLPGTNLTPQTGGTSAQMVGAASTPSAPAQEVVEPKK